jgi:hypothetical protein
MNSLRHRFETKRLLFFLTCLSVNFDGFSAIFNCLKPVPTAAFVTRTTRCPFAFNSRTTRDNRLEGNGMASLQINEVLILIVMVSELFLGQCVFAWFLILFYQRTFQIYDVFFKTPFLSHIQKDDRLSLCASVKPLESAYTGFSIFMGV